MEPLWSPVVATGGSRSQIRRPRNPQKQAETIALRCGRLPATFMVRRGSTVRVRQRALQKPRIRGFLFRINLQVRELGAGMEPFMEPSGRKLGPEVSVAPRCG